MGDMTEMITLPERVRDQCHLILQAARYGANIVSTSGSDGYTTINGVRCSLLQEWTVCLLTAPRMECLAGTHRPVGDGYYEWDVHITDTGRGVLAQWDLEVWGRPEPVQVGPMDCLDDSDVIERVRATTNEHLMDADWD